MKPILLATALLSFLGVSTQAAEELLTGEWRDGPNGSIYLKTADGRNIQIFPWYGQGGKTFPAIRQLGIKKIVVHGFVEPWGNGSFFIRNGLKSIEPDESELQKIPKPPTVSYVDILMNPEKFSKQTVTMEGTFHYNNTDRKSFDMAQGDNKIEVFYEQLPKDTWRTILLQKNFSDVKVSATGIIRKFGNEENTYYLQAKSVAMPEPQ